MPPTFLLALALAGPLGDEGFDRGPLALAQASCLECHSGADAEGELRLDEAFAAQDQIGRAHV